VKREDYKGKKKYMEETEEKMKSKRNQYGNAAERLKEQKREKEKGLKMRQGMSL
jgi:hypothetical protein